MKNSLLPLKWFIITLWLALSGIAQPQNEAPKTVAIEFTGIAWEKPITDVSFRVAGGRVDLNVPDFKRSRIYKYTGPSRLEFERETLLADGGREWRTVASLTVPDGAQKLLLLFLPGADGTWKVIPLAEDLTTFPKGMARVINATPYAVAVKGPQSVHTIEPGAFCELAGNGRMLTLKVAYAKGGRWKPATNNVFVLRPEDRRTVFVTTSDSSYFKIATVSGDVSEGQLQIFSVTE